MRALRAYDWPGNVRELSHAVERAVVLATGRTITRDCLPEGIRQAAGPGLESERGEAMIAVPVGTPLEDVEKLVITETLRHTGGNKAQAASLLGISARTIYRRQGAPSEDPDE
jgi:two-component system response regulator HydG